MHGTEQMLEDYYRMKGCVDSLERELMALWHFSACPFDHCQRCIDDEEVIKGIRDRLGPPTDLCEEQQ